MQDLMKFRAWDEENEEMLYSDKDYEKCTFVCESEGILKCYVPKIIPASLDEPEHIVGREIPVIMQFTGLKDKNGKEIYEGDTIEADGMFNDSIIFDEGGFNLKGGDSGLNLLYQLERYGDYKVIGNIHDNPELLEKKQ